MSGNTDFGREKQFLSRMEQQWPGLLYLCRNTEQFAAYSRQGSNSLLQSGEHSPVSAGTNAPCVGQCLCLQFPVSLRLNLHWPLSRERAFGRANNTVWWGRNNYLQGCCSTCADSGWRGISAASLSCSWDLWKFPSFVSEPSSITSTRR